jgi:hypothetical protein
MNHGTRQRRPERPDGCALCGHECELTFHHLIPRKLHRRKGFRRQHSRQALAQGIHICRLCHDGVHDLYDEVALASSLNTLQRLQQDPAIRRHVAWVRKQKRTTPKRGR